jgi:ADP-dependent NAD(P)H-hydrate dehydratase / NAD(P)H-hydrate epimerase
MKICRVNEMREMDQRAISEFGIAQELLMENAGESTYFVIKEVFGQEPKSVTVFCGIGNNGGDGLVVARKLNSIGWNPEIILLGNAQKFKGAAKINYEISQKLGLTFIPFDKKPDVYESLATAELIVDAIFGTGLDRNVTGDYLDCINLINESEIPVISVDIPSGINGDTSMVMGTAIQADFTITYGLPKLGNILFPGHAYGGKLFTTFISFPPEMHQSKELRIETNRPYPLPVRHLDSHKGSCGKVLFVSGSSGYMGAPYFSAMSFLKSGGGLSFLATPDVVAPHIGSEGNEIVLLPQKSTKAGSLSIENKVNILKAAEQCDMVVIGPGLSLETETKELVRELVAELTQPVLIDGDGLTAISENINLLSTRTAPTILTPHPGEMARLLNNSIQEIEADKINVLQKKATEWNSIIVLKGAHSQIALPDGGIYINLTGNPGMATAGSGDVLSGTIPAMYGLGFNVEHAVQMGVYVHGLAGDLAADDIGEDGLLAGDIMNYLPEAISQLRNDFMMIDNRYADKITVI